MASDSQIEAQRLVSISLSKMAQSRTQRTGVSLHKSLLVATVLQKARFLCMEEVFRMVHSCPVYNRDNNRGGIIEPGPSLNLAADQQRALPPPSYFDVDDEEEEDDDEYEEEIEEEDEVDSGNSNVDAVNLQKPSIIYSFNGYSYQHYRDQSSISGSFEYDKENVAPFCRSEGSTYLDLDEVYRDPVKTLKRRRAIIESENDDLLSFTIKRSRTDEDDDSVFVEDCPERRHPSAYYGSQNEDSDSKKGMDIDRITSLVSIFSFSNLSPSGSSHNGAQDLSTSCNPALSRSSSAPDLCSAQAKETENLQQRHFLAMTV